MVECADISVITHQKPQHSQLDFLAGLAFVEAVGYEDLNFITRASDLLAEITEKSSIISDRVFTFPHTERRLSIIPASSIARLDSLGVADFVCLTVECDPKNRSDISKLQHQLSKILDVPAAVCLSWRCRSCDVSDVIELHSSLRYIRWALSATDVGSVTYGGLFLSRHWRQGISRHIAKVVANYTNALVPFSGGLSRLAVTYA